MRLAVIGSKEFNDYEKLRSVLDKITGITAIISGAAPGADALAARYAAEHNLKLLEFPPDQEKHGTVANHVRDRQIVENCDRLIAFWDRQCAGTKYTIDYAQKQQIPVKITYFE